MPLTTGLRPGAALAVRCAGVLLIVAVLAIALHGVGLAGPASLDSLFSGWLYYAAEVGAATLVLTRALAVPRERLAWLLLAVGIAGFTAGDIYHAVALEHTTHSPFPSPSDAGYLLLYPCAFGMLMRLAGSHVRHLHKSIWLDGAICGLAIAALGSALVLEPVIHSTHGSFAAVATNLAYPLGDVALIMLVICVFAVTGWRPGGTWVLIAAGFSLMAVADSVYMFRIAEGTWQTGTTLDALWPAGLTMLGFAAWAEPREETEVLPSRLSMLLLPGLFSALALFLLIRADFVHLPLIPELLAAGALLIARWRFVITFTDMLALSEHREQQASTDELTGLHNRRQFYAQLGASVEGCEARGGSFALLMIDLDHFKELNDTLGHYAGDLLLRQIGPRMQGVLREGATIARLGGDEFGLILRDGEAATAVAVAERIHQALLSPFSLKEVTVAVHASIGIALFPRDAEDGDVLLQRADVAMYKAKENRSRYAFYEAGSDPNSRERLGLAAELKDALAHGGLVVHYQPQMRLDRDSVSAIEALVRWQHPQRGLIEAEDFMTLVEHTGVMRELTTLVLEQALGQQRSWRARGHDLTLAVNISAQSLLEDTFVDDLKSQLARAQTPPRRLRLEITESILISEGERVRTVIEALAELGVELSLDDFGTGYSPLTYLTEMPVSELKIDGSFTAAMMHDRPTSIIIAGTVSLAKQLGLALVAEGVETPEQLTRLREIGCPFAQGYLLCRPMSAQQLDRWLAAGATFEVQHQETPAEPLPGLTRAQQASAPLFARMPARATFAPAPALLHRLAR
ncbi:MAG TPA: EAL domain-containing protein [Solirubrobacteraceae bacterium]|jgi:diguanylate cyclase (GGDEF)-like protein